MQWSIKSCVHCLQHEGNLSKVALHPIVATTLMDLLHVDFTSIEMTLELNRPPKITNVLVFQDHFTKHIMAYVTPNQLKQLPSSCIRVTSQSLEPQPGSWAIRVLTSQAASLMRCVGSSVWRIVDQTVPPTNKRVGGEITSNHYANDQEAGRRQEGQLARTSGWNSAYLQCHPICCYGV